MDNGEKNSKAMQGVKSSDWLSDNFGVRFRYNALGDLNTKTLYLIKIALVLQKTFIPFLCIQVQL